MTDPPRVSFEYFVVRCVPRVDREEFVNVGVVLYSQEPRFLEAACRVDPERLKALAPELDLDDVDAYLKTIGAICRGDRAAGPAAQLGPRRRFEWLSAPRSTVVQAGPVHSGLTRDPAAELRHLLEALVL
ncbi:MAG: DUF3037 domain-containing protein [Actinomycetota bacterium]